MPNIMLVHGKPSNIWRISFSQRGRSRSGKKKNTYSKKILFKK